MRQISLDIETTGLLFYKGHRIIEICCVEIINKKITNKTFHTYINPNRLIDKSAQKITGIGNDFLKNKPYFIDIIDNFFKFINKADEIIIHNANFDINFINNELRLNNYNIKNIKKHFKIFDTLNFARKIHPGKKNNLDALCQRYNVANNIRKKHSALIDAILLAEIYIEMTSKQEKIIFKRKYHITKQVKELNSFNIIKANKKELKIHAKYINLLKEYK